MKKLITIALCVALASCVQVRDFLSDPKTAVALAQARGWAQVVTCDIANLTAVAVQIEQAVAANKAAQDTTGKVYTVSAIVCTSLGGTVTAIQAAK